MPAVLMITYDFPPSASAGVFRLLGFARHLPKFGWNVAVVAPPSLPWEPNDPALLEQVPKETVVHYVPYPVKAPKAIRWFAPYAIWVPFARAAARRAVEEHRPNVILTSGPPHWVHLIGAYLQRRFHLPWLADFRDPWVTGAFGKGMTSWQRRWQRRFEKRVMRRADLVVHNTPAACAIVQKAYPEAAARMTYLTNGYDPERFPATLPEPRHDAPVRILHAGQLYMGRDPRPILDAVAGLTADSLPPFQLEFVGRTEYAPGTNPLTEAQKRGVQDRLVCRPQIGYEGALAEMCSADVLLLLEPPDRDLGVPAKLYEYLGAGRPILAATGGSPDLKAILEESNAPHRLVPCLDVPAIRTAMADLIRGVRSGAIRPASEDARKKFSRETLTRRLAEMLDGLRRKEQP
jgi:glycosyltransferase involved in cell wall biosynthesis